jgi:hypothetical protein
MEPSRHEDESRPKTAHLKAEGPFCLLLDEALPLPACIGKLVSFTSVPLRSETIQELLKISYGSSKYIRTELQDNITCVSLA